VSGLLDLVLDELAKDPEALARFRALVIDGQGPERWVGVQQAAEHLGCKPQRIYNLVNDRAIPYRKDGSRLLFRLSELDAWLEH
jgi:excisionase family DNA binding protein